MSKVVDPPCRSTVCHRRVAVRHARPRESRHSSRFSDWCGCYFHGISTKSHHSLAQHACFSEQVRPIWGGSSLRLELGGACWCRHTTSHSQSSRFMENTLSIGYENLCDVRILEVFRRRIIQFAYQACM